MRIVRTGVCALAVLGLAASVFADGPRPLVIVSAEVSVTGELLIVKGARFGQAPEVRLDGVLLGGVVVNDSGTQLTANMPALPPGSYLLEMSRGYKWEQWLPAQLTRRRRRDRPAGRSTGCNGERGRERASTERRERRERPGIARPPGAGRPHVPAWCAAPRILGVRRPLVCGLSGPPVACGDGTVDAVRSSSRRRDRSLGAGQREHLQVRFHQRVAAVLQRRVLEGGRVWLRSGGRGSVVQAENGKSEFRRDRFLDRHGAGRTRVQLPVSRIRHAGAEPRRPGRRGPVFYSEASLFDSHGAGQSVTNVVCTTP